MLKLALAVSILAVAAPAFAQDAEPVGFTRDGKLFVVARYDLIGSTTIGSYVVWDTRTGAQVGAELEKDELPEWKAAHPLAPLARGRTSPDKKLSLNAPGDGSWSKDRWDCTLGVSLMTGDPDPDATPVEVPKPSRVAFRIEEGKASRAVADFTFSHRNENQHVEPIWSPDGKRLALVVHEEGVGAGPSADYQVIFAPTRSPRVELLAPRNTADDKLAPLLDALEQVGLPVTASGESKDPHPQVTVFAAKGFEQEAKRAAAALPGSKVEPLTWKPGYDLVVVAASR